MLVIKAVVEALCSPELVAVRGLHYKCGVAAGSCGCRRVRAGFGQVVDIAQKKQLGGTTIPPLLSGHDVHRVHMKRNIAGNNPIESIVPVDLVVSPVAMERFWVRSPRPERVYCARVPGPLWGLVGDQ